MTLEFAEVSVGKVAGGCVEFFTHIDTTRTFLFSHVDLLQETSRHCRQGILGPRLKKAGISKLYMRGTKQEPKDSNESFPMD